MTTIYLIRHSEGFQKLQGNILTKDSVQLIYFAVNNNLKVNIDEKLNFKN